MTFDLGSGILLGVVIAVVVWLGCAYYTYLQARERGRRPWLWAVLGIVFGPFALLAILLLPYAR